MMSYILNFTLNDIFYFFAVPVLLVFSVCFFFYLYLNGDS